MNKWIICSLPGKGQPRISSLMQMLPSWNQERGLMRMYRATSGTGSMFSTGVSFSLFPSKIWAGQTGGNGNISASNWFLVVLVIECKITFQVYGGSGHSCSLRMAILPFPLENSVSVPWDLVLKSMASLRDNLQPGPAFPPLSFLTKHVLLHSPHLQIRF